MNLLPLDRLDHRKQFALLIQHIANRSSERVWRIEIPRAAVIDPWFECFRDDAHRAHVSCAIPLEIIHDALGRMTGGDHDVNVRGARIDGVEIPAAVFTYFFHNSIDHEAGLGVQFEWGRTHGAAFSGFSWFIFFEARSAGDVVGSIDRAAVGAVQPCAVGGEGDEVAQWVHEESVPRT